jgi:hypothetical protein
MSTTLHSLIDVGISKHIGKYSDAVEVPRPVRWLLTSGTPGLTADGSLPETFELQAERVLILRHSCRARGRRPLP